MNLIGELLSEPIVLVDIGARNGILEIPDLKDFTTAYGFEPNPDEFDKVISNATDLETLVPGARIHYKEERYLPYAITDKSGECVLYITKGAGASSTLLPNYKMLDDRFYHDKWRNAFTLIKQENVKCKTLDEFISEAEIDHIDYIKLDTQGNEFDILNSVRNLEMISIIKTEVELLPIYLNQKLYHDISTLLYSKNFVQFDLKFEEIHRREVGGALLDGRPLVWADAYYINMGITNPNLLVKQSLILLFMGYADMALEIVRKHNLFSDDVFFKLNNLRLRKRRWTKKLQKIVERAIGLRISRV